VGLAMNIENTDLGYEIKTPAYTVFFGGVGAQIHHLKHAYPQFDFIRLKQIHSDAVVESTDPAQDYLVHGDAHYTNAKGVALCVITADCVPAFLYHERLGLIAGIHAGWRGVASKIIPKTIQKLNALGAKSEEIGVIIGPHIQKPSFEVGRDVRDQILVSIGQPAVGSQSEFFENISEEKSLVDLNQVVKAQLEQNNILAEHVSGLHIDTFTDTHFHSHRRDKEKAGRQISFIVRHK
jgi:YfiH family protein